MKPIVTVLLTASAVAASVFTLATLADRSLATSTRLADGQAQIERGRYLVHRVGMCTDCHSPRNEKGEFIEEKHLTGSLLKFAPIAAPKIAGLPVGFTPDDTVRFLMTGKRPNGRPDPQPPMPAYRLERADAEAVTAYLQSLAPAAK